MDYGDLCLLANTIAWLFRDSPMCQCPSGWIAGWLIFVDGRAGVVFGNSWIDGWVNCWESVPSIDAGGGGIVRKPDSIILCCKFSATLGIHYLGRRRSRGPPLRLRRGGFCGVCRMPGQGPGDAVSV